MSINDIIVWPDDTTGPTWCYRYELEEMNHMSDDHRTIPVESKEWEAFVTNNA